MHHQYVYNIKNTFDIPTWQQMLNKFLTFHEVIITNLNPIFKGTACIDIFSSLPFIQSIKIDMSPNISKFICYHNNQRNKHHGILIHSLSNLIINDTKKNIHLPAYSYMIIPAWQSFTIKSQSYHYSLMFVFNINDSGLKQQSLSAIFWKIGNYLHYGNIINKLLCDYYQQHTDESYKKLLKAIKMLLSLQSEKETYSNNSNQAYLSPNIDVSAIINVIHQNMTNPHYSLEDLSAYFGITGRLLQYKLSRYKLTFSGLLFSSRCELLTLFIQTIPDTPLDALVRSCGFTSLRMANRQFKKLRKMTVNQFHASQLKSN